MKITVGKDSVNLEGIFSINNPVSQERKRIILMNQNNDIVEDLYTFRLGELVDKSVYNIKDEEWGTTCNTLKTILINNTPMNFDLVSGYLDGNINELRGLNIPVKTIDNYREMTKKYVPNEIITPQSIANNTILTNSAINNLQSATVAEPPVNANNGETIQSGIPSSNVDSKKAMLDDIKKMKEAISMLEYRINSFYEENENSEYKKAA